MSVNFSEVVGLRDWSVETSKMIERAGIRVVMVAMRAWIWGSAVWRPKSLAADVVPRDRFSST